MKLTLSPRINPIYGFFFISFFILHSGILVRSGILPDGNTLILSNILSQGINQVKKLQSTYEKITQFTEISIQTKNEISSLLKLESEIRNDLLKASNIKNLRVSDILYFARQNVSMKGNQNDYLDPNSFFGNLLKKINSKSEDLMLGINLYNKYHSGFFSFGNSQGLNKSSSGINGVYNQLGLETYMDDQKGRVYQILQNFSSRYEEQALELESLIKSDNLYAMNSSERMNLLLQAGNLMEKSIYFRMEANKILESPPGKTVQAQNKALELVQMQSDLSSWVSYSKKYADINFSGDFN